MTLMAVALGAFTACSDDDNNIPEPPATVPTETVGAYILNTGNWGGNDASIQYLDIEKGTVSADLYAAANNEGLGDLGQDLCLYGSKLYATVSGSSKIVIMDKNCKVIKSIPLTNAENQPINPRYMTAVDGNVYFTAYDGTVSRLDTLSMSITGSVEVGDHPEALTNANGKLYVNISGYGSGKTVAVIDLTTFTKTKDIETVLNPYTQCITGDDGYVYVVSNGNYAGDSNNTAMGKKYLGEHFDIHGGGMDLIFPHHECEIAQSVASQGDDMVHYWMHNNMITINGQKMGKSYGNFINLSEFFEGSHKLLTQAYSPMTIRFFILQAHYRSTVDFSNEALQAAEKGLERLTEAVKGLERITPAAQTTGIEGVKDLREKCYAAMNDDMNSPIVIAHLFDGARMINTVLDKKATLSAEDLEELKSVFHLFMYEILGLKEEAANNEAREEAYGKVVDMLLEQRMKAKANKDWATSDKIRDELAALGFEVKDTKDGFTWRLNK